MTMNITPLRVPSLKADVSQPWFPSVSLLYFFFHPFGPKYQNVELETPQVRQPRLDGHTGHGRGQRYGIRTPLQTPTR